MPIIQPSALIAGISGSIGGVTFKNTKTGLVASKRPQACNQKTAHQAEAHRIYLRCLAYFRTMNADLRTAWQNAARAYNRRNRLGLTTAASPWSLFLEANYYPVANGLSSAVSLPTYSRLPGPEYIQAWFPMTDPWILAPTPEVETPDEPLLAVHAGRTLSPVLSGKSPQMVYCRNAKWSTPTPPITNRYILFYDDLVARQGTPLLNELIYASVRYWAVGYLPSVAATTRWWVGPTDQPKP